MTLESELSELDIEYGNKLKELKQEKNIGFWALAITVLALPPAFIFRSTWNKHIRECEKEYFSHREERIKKYN